MSIYDKIYSFLTFSDRPDFEKQGGKREDFLFAFS